MIRSGWLAPAERSALSRIESLRSALLASDERINTTDYGAGDGTEALTADAMSRGRSRVVRVGDVCRASCKEPEEAALLFRMVRLLRPLRCIELGTCLGLTAAYIGAALELNGDGSLVTVEGCPRLAALAAANLEQLGMRSVSVRAGRFADVLPELLADATFDFAYIDGHHDREATLAYFDAIASHAPHDGAVVIDDIGWSDGMKSAWAAVTARPDVLTSGSSHGFGVCFVSPRQQPAAVSPARVRATSGS